MQKFVALLSTPAATMAKWMETTTEEERATQMETMMTEWNAWMEEHKDSFVGEGLPLGKTKRVTIDGVIDARNDLNYFMVVKADSHEDAAALFVGNPHLKYIPDSHVDVMGTMGPTQA